MIGLVTKTCTRRHECDWRKRCQVAMTENGLLPITPQHTAERCDFFANIEESKHAVS